VTTLGDALVEFVVDTPESAIPARARANAIDTVVDAVATTWAGISEDGAAVIRDATLAVAPSGESRVAGRTERYDAASAALCNAAAAHALDYDAINFAVSGFVGSATVAALSAVAEERDLAPRDVITSYCLGWEASAVLGRALNPEHYALGWHPTATLALMSATTALARLVGLDHDQTRAALSVAVSEASGVKIMIGNMLNAYHVGKAARNAITAVRFAAAGFVGNAQPLDAPQGFLALFAGPSGAQTEHALASVGTTWDLVDPGPVWKVHACCGLIHSAADVVRADVLVHAYVPKVMHVQHPTTGYAAKFCIPYCVAAAIRDGRAGLSDFDSVDPELVSIGERVSYGVHPDLQDGDTFFEKEFTDVRLHTTKGVFDQRVLRLQNRGTGSITDTTLREKFRECVSRTPAMARDADAEFDRIRAIDSADRWELWAT
jgi:2-methylcitrate dehydratase PrpD